MQYKYQQFTIFLSVYRVYKSAHLKYWIYKPREIDHPIKETSALAHKLTHSFLYRMFNLPRFINPIFLMGRFNKFYTACTLIELIDYLNLLFSTV